jgi:hypothetical protein
MRQIVAVLLASLLAAATAAAQSSTLSGSNTKKSSSASSVANINAQLAEMRKAIESQQQAIQTQQQQMQQLMDQLKSRDSQIQQLQQQAGQAQEKSESASSAVTQQQAAVATVQSDVSDLKATQTSVALSLQESQKNLSEPPTTLHFKGITITPGGFLAAEFVRRSRALGADINTPFNSLTLPGASQSRLSEFYGSGRQSRISMLAEGRVKDAKLTGYVEADFLSAGVTSNNNQSNSYTLRQRQAWGQAAFDNGWSFTGGQMWSLVTETKHGVDNRTEAVPLTIDPQYTVGFSWARQYGLRASKNFGNKMWLAVAIENPQTTLATVHNNAANFLLGSLGNGGGLYNSVNGNYSFNQSPDVIAKAVFEPGFGHYEVFGIFSRFRDRVFPCAEASATFPCGGSTTPSSFGAFNSGRSGGGVGANARWSFVNKHLDFGLHALGGSGVGRYGTGGLADTTVHADGTLALLKSYQALGTLEWHGPKLDVYFNGGAEYAGRNWQIDPISGKAVGYGSPLFSNTTCTIEPVTGSGGFTPGSLGSTCTGDTRVLIEGTGGFWFRFYNGPKGKVQWGPQFSYVTRNTWSGLGGAPHGIDGMIFTSFRYYLP